MDTDSLTYPCNESYSSHKSDCNLTVFVKIYYLQTSKSEFLCFSYSNQEYYFSESRNDESIFLSAPQKEQETIELYFNITKVFITPVVHEIDIRELS